ncbi:MAG: glycosyltransferase [Clostridia bacterium]|nr:glycosyltransferase [Clostridia bacterium]
MEPKVSVIVPVYKCEAFLPQCIASLRAQTLAEIELIFVCDGSPDGSLAILREAQMLDARVRVIDFAQNRGVSAARNAGLDAARGEFVGFCDGDDWAEPQMYERLYGAAVLADADASFCRVFKDYENRQENVPLGFATGTRFDRASIRKTLIPAMLSKETDSDELPLSGYTPRNLFRRTLLCGHRFREDIHYAEDLLFIVACMLDADAATAVDEAYYHYRFHAGSVTKRYSPHVPQSYDLSNDALEALLADEPECMARMVVRRRKMAVTSVRNLCYPGTPYGFAERVRRARAYMNRADVRSWFAGVRPLAFAPRLAMRLALMKHRMAFCMCLLFSYVFDRV